jgi:hypothetical protein
MPTNFLSLPSELRNVIYEQVIPGSIAIVYVKSYLYNKLRRKKPLLGLVLANKRISLEACSVMYATTCFNFNCCDAEELAAFLTHIGRRNASFISDVVVDFPRSRELSRGEVELDDDSAASLAVMREFCKSLRTVTTDAGNAISMEKKLQELGDEEVATEAVGLVDEWFGSLGLLRQIIIQLGYDSTFVRGEMRRRGWKIEEVDDDECCGGLILFD